MMNLKPKKLRIILLSVIGVILFAVITIFMQYQTVSEQPEKLISAAFDGTDMSMENIRHTATKDGKKEWSLEAKSAHLVNSKNQLILKDVCLVFFMKNKEQIQLSADQGILYLESSNINLQGNVAVINENMKMKTKILNYHHSTRIIVSDVPIEILNSSAYITADSMRYDLNKSRAEFKGNVKGLLNENFFTL